MNDTRLIHAMDAIAEADTLLAGILADQGGTDEDRSHAQRARTFLARARWFTAAAAKGMACNHGQTCRRDLGHTGPHTTIRAVR